MTNYQFSQRSLNLLSVQKDMSFTTAWGIFICFTEVRRQGGYVISAERKSLSSQPFGVASNADMIVA